MNDGANAVPTQGEPAEGVQDERSRRLDALGQTLAMSRSEAIAARQSSGIEAQWAEDEEFYNSVDDANRNERTNSWRSKPPGQYVVGEKSTTRSTIFLNIIRPYCDAAAARFSDMIIPADEANFTLGPTPIPDLMDLANGKIPPQIMASAQQVQPGNQQAMQQAVQQAQQQAAQLVTQAKAKAKKAQARIEDWQIEGGFHAQCRSVIDDAARMGSGVLKGPIPHKVRTVAFKNNVLLIDEEIKPYSRRVDPWNFYPDGSCGENIHNGRYTWERDRLTEKQLSDLMGSPGYMDDQISLAIDEGPQMAIAPAKDSDARQQVPAEDKRYEIWYYYGTIGREELEAAGWIDKGPEALDKDGKPKAKPKRLPAQIEMVNEHVIKATINALDTGDYPYDVIPWQKKPGIPWGDGIARQGRAAQRIILAGVRSMLDNAGICAGPQIVLKQGMIEPADGEWNITPRKVWWAAEDADIDDVRKAMQFFDIPSRQAELMQIIQFGLKMMEDSTGLPMLLQGQVGEVKGEPLGTVQIANNNAGTVLRRLARTFDDLATEPHIKRYYTWILQYGEDDEKGDLQVDARGSSALVERDLQSTEIGNMAKIVTNPMFGIDPKKWSVEYLKSKRFDPANFMFDDAAWEKVVQSLVQKPADPRVEVAKLNADAKQKITEMEQQAEAAEKDKDRQVDLLIANVNERIAEIKTQGATEISFDKLKAMLADSAIKIQAQRQISAAQLAVDIHKHHIPAAVLAPPVEPAGRAPAGQSFAQ